MRFKDKSVIITGGGGKIAKAYAMAFAREGANLSLPDIASAEAVVKAIKGQRRHRHQYRLRRVERTECQGDGGRDGETIWHGRRFNQ
jgi:NAD(P)-dependent dehydrogenase (short-subunit alcohol dehydrogenase family)